MSAVMQGGTLEVLCCGVSKTKIFTAFNLDTKKDPKWPFPSKLTCLKLKGLSRRKKGELYLKFKKGIKMNNFETAKLKVSDWVMSKGDRVLLQAEPTAVFIEKISLQLRLDWDISDLQSWQWRKAIVMASHCIDDLGDMELSSWKDVIDSVRVKKDKPKKRRNRKKRQEPRNMDNKWLQVRYKALQQNNGCCELCGRSRKDGIKLHVDHIKPKSTHQHLQYDLDNLQVLCDECNVGKSNKDDTDWR